MNKKTATIIGIILIIGSIALLYLVSTGAFEKKCTGEGQKITVGQTCCTGLEPYSTGVCVKKILANSTETTSTTIKLTG